MSSHCDRCDPIDVRPWSLGVKLLSGLSFAFIWAAFIFLMANLP